LPSEANSLEPVVAHGYPVADVDTLARKAATLTAVVQAVYAGRGDLAVAAMR
jgi:hypothetical protein